MFDRGLDLMTRKAITILYSKRYKNATSKKEKSQILTEFVSTTGYNRSYASWLLRNAGKKVTINTPNGKRYIVVADPKRKIKRKRKRVYDQRVRLALIKIWTILDYPNSMKLKAILPKIIPKLEAHGEILLEESVREKLFRISRATIDRLLSKERKRMRLKPRAKTKPGTLLKKQIPIRTHAGWKEDEPGFLEIDLISHDGGYAKGEFAYTLVMTDIKTQWTEVIPVRNRAQRWTLEAMKEAMERFPFRIKGIDTDNDSAFINKYLLEWTREEVIIFTRSRPYWKNDNCHVEQKNWSIGRRYLGYLRYDTEEALEVIKEIGELLSLYVNYFQPSMKLVRKERIGSKVRKEYDEPKTPYERVLESPEIEEGTKEKLRARYEELNPAELHRRIKDLQERLFRLATPVRGMKYE